LHAELTLTRWYIEIEFIEKNYLTSNQEIGKLSLGMKIMFKIANFPHGKNIALFVGLSGWVGKCLLK
jgi:hypothetical protein